MPLVLHGVTCTNLYTSKTAAIDTTMRATYKIMRLCGSDSCSTPPCMWRYTGPITAGLYTRQEDLQQSSPQGPSLKVIANSCGIIAVGFCGHQLCICGWLGMDWCCLVYN